MDTRQAYDRLLPIINQIDKVVTCQSVITNLDGTFTLGCLYPKWAVSGYDITIGGIVYTIVEVVYGVSIRVKGSIIPAVLTFNLYPPIFKHGTIKRVASELDAKTLQKEKLPLIFLHEIVDESLHLDSFDSVDVDADCRLYFLTSCDYANWDQLQGDTLAIAPMRSLCKEFVKVLAISQYISQLTGTGNVKSYNIFGTVNENGAVKNIFNDFLSGVQLRISIPFLKDFDCVTNPTLDNRCAPAYVLDSLGGNIVAVLYSNDIYIDSGGVVCLGVNIKDQLGNIIAVVPSGGNYNVTVLTEIEDTIDSNTSTIIDPLI